MIDLEAAGDPSTRGWGPGWPHDNIAKMRAVVWSNGTYAPAGMRLEVARLVTLLGNETMKRGYRLHYGWCWGFADRAIAGTKIPSLHSWGLAVDINAPRNPREDPVHTDMPGWMPNLWNRYGFRWGGDYQHTTPDPMHYEFMGTPAEALAMTDKASADFEPPPPPPKPVPIPVRTEDREMMTLVVGREGYVWTGRATDKPVPIGTSNPVGDAKWLATISQFPGKPVVIPQGVHDPLSILLGFETS